MHLRLSFHFAGGFYSDSVGHVAKSCKMCPNGSFVSIDNAPGKRPQDCKSCPEGKQLSKAEKQKVSVTEAGRLRECENTEIVWEFIERGFD